ncbi:MAG: amidohydrolase [Candidatus Electrothrix sp. YB6]
MKPDILITDICLPGTSKDQPLSRDCCIAVQGNLISRIGPAAEFSGIETKEAKTVINGHGQLAISGLINCHCHGAMTLFRGLADDLRLDNWLNNHIFPAEAKYVAPEMVYWCTKLAAAEMILSGTTTVADGYFHENEAARAFADAGMRAAPAQGIIDFPAPGVPDPSKKIDDTAATFLDRWKQHPLISPAVFAHSPYTCCPDTLLAAKELARAEDVLLFIHTAETRQEAGMIPDMQGGSPIRHLRALELLDASTVCVHSVWADEEDLDILAETGAAVVVCPQSNLKLASGTAPLRAMLDRNIRVGIGTDGAASNNSLDLFREMDICAKLQKLHSLDPVAVPASDILRMATSGGAAVLGSERDTGVLEAGKKADIILIDLDSPRLRPMHGLDLLVYAAQGADVQTVLIDGKLVMQDRSIRSFDLDKALHQVRLLAGRVRKRIRKAA